MAKQSKKLRSFINYKGSSETGTDFYSIKIELPDGSWAEEQFNSGLLKAIKEADPKSKPKK